MGVRPRVLVVSCLYGTRVRLLVEAEMGRRGWGVAVTPAEAGVMVVCGTPGDSMRPAVRGVWEAVPRPRTLVELAAGASGAEVARALDLSDGSDPSWTGPRGDVGMAARGADRDGLRLDRLHVPLGPVLADWPAGLVVETVLQGDVIQEAVVRVLPPGEEGMCFWADGDAAWRLDSLGRLFGVAGWPWAAREARRLRDRLLHGGDVGREHERFARRVRGSRVLRWMLRGVGRVEGDVPGWMRGDVLDRTYAWLNAVETGIAAPDHAGGGGRGDAAVALALLPGLLTGAELAVARLIVASLDPDLERLPGEPRPGPRTTAGRGDGTP
ncbi:hypothetical protein GCM10009850_116410 [Nonomuraea monospora]|uniref:Uncharacterized protein n=1 Tax=Nonomuraea monospora TaxID=568818 RepID=A0ABN3D2V7_9ACTN